MQVPLLKHIRIHNWWQYKIPPLIAAFFLGILTIESLVPCNDLYRLAMLLVWMFSAAAVGYFINDWADIAEDKLSGKANTVKNISPTIRAITVIILSTTALLSLYLVYGLSLILFLGALQLLLFVLYSVPPIRLKNTVAGVLICDTLYAHVLPTLIAYLAGCREHTKLFYLITIGLWQTMVGVRNITLHHVQARHLDKKAGSANITAICSPKALVKNFNTIWPIPEVAILIVLLWTINPIYSLAVLMVYAWHWYVVMYKWGHSKHAHLYYNSTYLFLNNFYEQYLPLILITICCCTISFLYIPVFIGFSLLFPAYNNTIKQDLKAMLG